jgi:pimeloyl-ACP methyl ester carboxylesterase
LLARGKLRPSLICISVLVGTSTLATLLLFGCTGRGSASSASTASSPSAASANPSEEAVRFTNGDITLAGTLLLPAGAGQHPAVVLFHGSGAQSRDLFTARWFAAQGFAALAYDKRGVGESTGNFRAVPFMDICGDGLAGLAYLKSRKEIDAKHIGVWGLSQGGWLGPLAASRSADVAFVIAVSGPGVSPGEQMLVYYANELRAQGVAESDVEEATRLRRDVWHYLSSGEDYAQAKREFDAAPAKRWYNQVKSQHDDLFGSLPGPSEVNKPDNPSLRWFKREMNYDPVPALRALRVPALFLFGGEDRMIPVEKSVAVIRQVLAESGNRDFTIHVFPHADHGMYVTAGEGAGDVDPEYFSTMKSWLAAHVPPSR